MVEVGETAVCALCGRSEIYSQAMRDFSFELYPDLISAPHKAEYCCNMNLRHLHSQECDRSYMMDIDGSLSYQDPREHPVRHEAFPV